jgi:outer membrane protein assembly factor BamD
VTNLSLRRWCAATLLFAAGCAHGFQVRNYPTNEALYRASMDEFTRKRWDNAAIGFERLTLDLGARDTLLATSHWYLAKTHEARREYLLAAQSYTRLAESFPDDTLAAAALLAAGDSYFKLWRSPTLDQQYGAQAQTQYRLVMSLFPDSPLRAKAEKGSLMVDEWMATKDYEIALHYVRRHAFESSLIYFKDVVKNYPNTGRARDALMRLVETYRRPELNYQEEARETCAALLTAYAGDKEVSALCSAGAEAEAQAKVKGKPAAPATTPGSPPTKPAEMAPKPVPKPAP